MRQLTQLNAEVIAEERALLEDTATEGGAEARRRLQWEHRRSRAGAAAMAAATGGGGAGIAATNTPGESPDDLLAVGRWRSHSRDSFDP